MRSGFLYGVPKIEGAAEGFFVGGDNGGAAMEDRGVGVCDGLVAGVVDEDVGAGKLGEEVEEVGDGEGGLGTGGEVVLPGGDVEA